MDTSRIPTILFLVGRLLVGGMFFQAGINNLINRDSAVGYAASKGLVATELLVVLANAVLVVAGFCFLTGFRPRLGILAAAVFLIPVNLIMHNFWAYDGMARELELHSFMGNLGLLGSALVFLAIPRPWALSLDAWLAASSPAPLPTPGEGSVVGAPTLARID